MKVPSVIPTTGTPMPLGWGGGDALPQMFRRCGWLNMTFAERPQVACNGQSITMNWKWY